MLASDDKNSVLAEVNRGELQQNAYSPYGHSPSGEGALGYNGELREGQVGWYLLGNGYRAFNPLLMRFHSPDSWSPFGEGGLNAYTYVMGDPVGYTDPTGHVGFIKRLAMAFMMSGDDAAMASGSIASSQSLVNVTSRLEDLTLGGRQSRVSMRQPSAGRGRSPTPDYESNSPDYSPVNSRSNSAERQTPGSSRNNQRPLADEVQTAADKRNREVARQKSRQERVVRKIERNRRKYPDEYKEAISVSKPNVFTGQVDGHYNKYYTTDVRLSDNEKFGLPVYKKVLSVPLKAKRVREYQ